MTLPPGPLESIDWGSQLAGNTVKVYFANAGEVFDGVASLAWTETQKQNVMAALGDFTNAIDLTFELTTNSSEATFKFAIENNSGVSYSAYMSPPGYSNSGIGVFNIANMDLNALVPGSIDYFIVQHEVGHGLGLAHPHDNGGTSDIMDGVASSGSLGDYQLNQGVHTIMTYNPGFRAKDPYPGDFGATLGPMALDIALLQDKYGAPDRNAGDSTYLLPVSNAVGTYYQTIWDTDGVDTFEYTGTADVFISLVAASLDYSATGGGMVSYAEGTRGGFTIANGVVIENAKGGSGNDILFANGAANVLNGGPGGFDTVSYEYSLGGVELSLIGGGWGGDSVGDTYISIERVIGSAFADLFHGSASAETIFGGTGTDSAIYAGSPSGVTINLATGVNTGGNAQGDDLFSIENVVGSGHDDDITAGMGANEIWGGGGNDKISGGEDSGTASGISLGSGVFFKTAGLGNNAISTAVDVSAMFALDNDPDIVNSSSTPHVTVSGTGDGTADFYAINILNSGAAITLDIDHTSGWDSYVNLRTAAGTVVASDDDSNTGDGAGGSTSGLDSFLTFTVVTAGLYFIQVGRYPAGAAIASSETYELQISVANELQSVDGDDIFHGETGNDELFGGDGNDWLFGGANDDRLFGGEGDDHLEGGAGFDVLSGEDGDDVLFGGDLADSLIGGKGNDTLHGEHGHDILYGQNGFDELFGGDGNDVLWGGAMADRLVGGAGKDKIIAGHGNDQAFGQDGNDIIHGALGADSIFGGADHDSLYGGAGNDVISGQEGNDILFGQEENDTLIGGVGIDVLWGGSGSDKFVFEDGFESDTIRDFDPLDDEEWIDFSNLSSITDWSDLLTGGHMTQIGNDVVIDSLAGDVLTVQNVLITDLNQNDFFF